MGVPPPPSVRLLGIMLVTRGDRSVPLPPSQKTRALLAYLAVTRREHARERLCELFWSETDDPRGALRWSLSKLRALDDEGSVRIRADRTTVAFEPAGAYVDVLEVRRAVAGGLTALSVEALRELAATFRGGFLDGVELPELDGFAAWRAAEREQLKAAHAQVLRELAGRLEPNPEQAVDAARELVRLFPEDESRRASLVQLLVAAGRREEAEEHYNLGRLQIAKNGVDRGELRDAWRKARSEPPRRSAVEADVARQEVRFCVARDGVRIAYATLGSGPTLVKTANWLSHLEYEWKSPLWRHLARELSRDLRLVRYDQRGNGLSDWQAEDLSLDAFVGDLEAVVGAAELERFALLGVSQGARVAIAYAVKHPEKVSHLILYGSGARGWKLSDKLKAEERAALLPLMRLGWGNDNPAFRQVFTSLFMPEATPEQATWFNELQRVSSSPESAVRIAEATGEVDVSPLLAHVRVPTLVMHAVEDAMASFDEGRKLAAAIPGARFVALQSKNHLLLDDEPAFARFLVELRAFLAEPSPAR